MMKAKKSERLVFPKEIVYNPKVKTGNWFEEQFHYDKNKYDHNSEYCREFQEKPMSSVPRNERWDILFKHEGYLNVCPPKYDDNSPNYFDNFASSYALSYSHFPKIAPVINEADVPKVRRLGKARPVLEMIDSYGNVNDYGLKDIVRRHVAYEEKASKRSTSLSTTEVDFVKPIEDGYVFCRRPRFRAIKKKTADVYPPLTPNHPRFSDYDIITWKRIDREKLAQPPNVELDC
ncbi:unnamed protein product [Phyllotreta striolata]|uniref:Uncharacterized protein n=1 Tax=Phyllotreta striolata TaxID=444603 RepID=A0A9N9TPZ5_PHYSR|nr:unnamed protein product [Phyllotreta striolata]